MDTATQREDNSKIWEEVRRLLRAMLNPNTFDSVVRSVNQVEIDGKTVTLEVPDEISKAWLCDNYKGLFSDTFTNVLGSKREIVFRVNYSSSSTWNPSGKAPELIVYSRPQLNPKNTFESFVVGETNNHAHAAAKAVSESPGKSYNPLFLYGASGLGKTHLIQAIGHKTIENGKASRVVYVSSEKFVNEYIGALTNSDLESFRRKYREVDLLIIDDVHFFAGKERIQEEFFHCFNILHDTQKQIVLTCDRVATEIENLEQRLVSRFEWGLVVDVQPPDVETRQAILRKKAEGMNVRFPDEILNFIAKRIRTNVRRLEGAFLRVASYSELTGNKLSLETAEHLLREILQEEGKTSTVTIDFIQRKVAEHFDIRFADMSSKRRPENIAFPRQIGMYLCRQLTDFSLSAIGDAFGGREASSILHGCRLVKDRMETDANVRQVVNYLERNIVR